ERQLAKPGPAGAPALAALTGSSAPPRTAAAPPPPPPPAKLAQTPPPPPPAQLAQASPVQAPASPPPPQLAQGPPAQPPAAAPSPQWAQAAPAQAAQPPAPPPPAPARSSSPAPKQLRGQPTVVDSGTLLMDGVLVHLDGIKGSPGEAAHELYRYIAGREVACDPAAAGAPQYRCKIGDYDLGEAVLLNGAGRAAPDAPERLREFEQKARTANRGIWRK